MCTDAPNSSKYGYQRRPNIVQDENSGLVTDSHSILAGGGTMSLNYCMYMKLMLGRQKYTHQTH